MIGAEAMADTAFWTGFWQLVAQGVVVGAILGFLVGGAKAILEHSPAKEGLYERERMKGAKRR